jgi:hypothetical protein
VTQNEKDIENWNYLKFAPFYLTKSKKYKGFPNNTKGIKSTCAPTEVQHIGLLSNFTYDIKLRCESIY